MKPPNRPKKISFYFRTSTGRQKEEDTIKTQIARAQVFLNSSEFKENYVLAPRRPEEKPHDLKAAHFVDDGYSMEEWREGTAIAALMDSISRGDTEVIWAYSTNRVFRSQSFEIVGKLLDCLRTYRIPVIDAGGIKNPDVVMSLIAVLDTEDKRRTVIRLHESKKVSTGNDGRPPNGKSPYGYIWLKKKKRWKVHPGEKKLLRWAGSLTAGREFEELPDVMKLALQNNPEGVSDREIADLFNQLGYNRKDYMKRNGFKKWCENPTWLFLVPTIASFFCIDRYCGKNEYRFKETDDLMHPHAKNLPRDKKQAFAVDLDPIFTPNEWKVIVSTRAKRQFINKKKRNVVNEYLLSDVLTCSECATLMAARAKYPKNQDHDQAGKPRTPILYYQCGRKKLVDKRCSRGNYYNAKVIEDIAWSTVQSVLLQPSSLKAIDQSSKGPVSQEALRLREAARANKVIQLAGLQEERKRVNMFLVKGSLTDEDAAAEKLRIASEVAPLSRDISRLDQEIGAQQNQLATIQSVDLIKLRKKYINRLGQLGFEEKRTIVRTLLKSIAVSPKPMKDSQEKAKIDFYFHPIAPSR